LHLETIITALSEPQFPERSCSASIIVAIESGRLESEREHAVILLVNNGGKYRVPSPLLYVQSIRVVLPGQPELETTGGGSRVSTT